MDAAVPFDAALPLEDAAADAMPRRDAANFDARVPFDARHALDDELRMNHVQMLATHNSYHVRRTPAPIPDWDYSFAPIEEQLTEQGVRGLELDLYVEGSPPSEVRVHHIAPVDDGTTCETLDACLAEIRRFSDAHPGHHPLFVQLEPKWIGREADWPAAFALIDQILRDTFPEELLVTPDFVRAGDSSLRERLAGAGWPTLGETRGRVMFAWDCDRDVALAYAGEAPGLVGRVAFVDSLPSDPFAAVMIANSPDDEARELVENGFFVRVFADGIAALLRGDPDELAAAVASGAQVISTDVPVARDGIDYVASIPEGTPSGCSPVVAPAACTASAVEDPALISPSR